jgi:hypothetical protein
MNQSFWTWPIIIVISIASISLLVFGDFLPPVRYKVRISPSLTLSSS